MRAIPGRGANAGTIVLLVLSLGALLIPGCGRSPAAGPAVGREVADATTSSVAVPSAAFPATVPTLASSPAPIMECSSTPPVIGSEELRPAAQDPAAETKIVITKSTRRLYLYLSGRLVQTYPIALGFAPIGDKEREGDGRTPEGRFCVCVKLPTGKFGPSLKLDYPGREDAERGLRQGLITEEERDRIVAALDAGEPPPMKTALGGEICIHAGGSDRDWTQGCVGLDRADMEGLYEAVDLGTCVLIEP